MITEEHRRHLSESHMGMKRMPEALAKARKTMKLKWKDLEYRNKVIQARVGHFTSEETKRKLSLAHISISLEQEKQIINLYANGLTAAEIEAELNIGQSVIFCCLKRNDIRKRPIGHRRGKPSWNKGIKFNQEQKAKMNMEGLKKEHPWNKGKTGVYSEEFLQKLRLRNKGRIGEKAYNWKGGISRAYKTGYNSIRYKEWRKAVFERDNYTCRDCEIHANEVGYLTAHHIKSFAKYPELRFEISNGKTLCEQCHGQTDNYQGKSKMEVN